MIYNHDGEKLKKDHKLHVEQFPKYHSEQQFRVINVCSTNFFCSAFVVFRNFAPTCTKCTAT